MKNSKFTNALIIGFFIGIIIWSIAKNTWGLVTLVPLFFIYRMLINSKDENELHEDK